MNFDLTEDQALLKASLERFVSDRYGGDIERRHGYLDGARGYSLDNWRILAELGALAMPFDEAEGGLGAGPVELVVAAEALGGGLVVEPWLSSIVLAGGLIADAGTATQKAAWLPRIIAGEARLALAQAETDARYELDTSGTSARAQGSGYVLSGRKTFVLAGAGADAFIVSANAANGLGLYLVPANAKGIEIRPYRLVDSSLAVEIALHDVALPADAKLAGGIEALEVAAARASLVACGEMLGLVGLLHRTTLEYARTRRQFGVPIGKFQVLQHRMVDDYGALEQARSITYRAALTGGGAGIAGAKAYVSEAALRIGHSAVQIHGGMGMTDELAVGHALKRVLLLSKLFGDARHMLRAFAKAA